MSSILRQLQDFAQAAVHHAVEVDDVELPMSAASDISILKRLDKILDRERSIGLLEHHKSFVLCYGAWLGEFMRIRLGGDWVGLNEPTPPRLRVQGGVYSPMDAVRRRLTVDHAPTMYSLITEISRQQGLTDDPDVRDQNRAGWDSLLNDPRFTNRGNLPADRDEALAAIDPWLIQEGPIDQKRLLCLAAGGGTHGPLHAMAGACVTVVDFSDKQLQIDVAVARTKSLQLQTAQSSMDDLSIFADASFDIVLHPVSLCYLRDVLPVYREVARVLKPGGLYVAQHKQPGSLQAGASWNGDHYSVVVPADDGYPLPASSENSVHRESGTIEFAHSLDVLLGGLCRCGFAIEDFQEPPRGDAWADPGSPEHRARFLPPFLKIKARRVGMSGIVNVGGVIRENRELWPRSNGN